MVKLTNKEKCFKTNLVALQKKHGLSIQSLRKIVQTLDEPPVFDPSPTKEDSVTFFGQNIKKQLKKIVDRVLQ